MTISKTKHSESLLAAVRYQKQQAQAKRSVNEEFKRLSSCLGTIVDSEDSAKIINLVSEDSDQGNLPNIMIQLKMRKSLWIRVRISL